MKEKLLSQMKIEQYLQLPYSIMLHVVEDEGKKYWIAEIPELPGCKSHGSNVEEAMASLEEAKKDWIQDGLERGEEIPLPLERDKYSGKILVRMPPSLHRALVLMSDAEKTSLNQLIVTLLAKEISNEKTLSRLEQRIDHLLNLMQEILDSRRTITTDNYLRYINLFSDRLRLTQAAMTHDINTHISDNFTSAFTVTSERLLSSERGWNSNIIFVAEDRDASVDIGQMKESEGSILVRG